MEKCIGEKRPESELKKNRILKVEGVDAGEKLKLQGDAVKRVKNFKYLGLTVGSDRRCEEEVRRRIQGD